MDSRIQQILDDCPLQGGVQLPSGEFEGPFHIRKSCTVVGGNTTLWAKKGPVLFVDAAGATIKNLRVEVTRPQDAPNDNACISAAGTAYVDRVSINGRVLGFHEEQMRWQFPTLLELGEFPAGKQAVFRFEVEVPAAAAVISRIDGLKVTPETLPPGLHCLELTLDAVDADSCVYGEIILESQFHRPIYVCGKAVANAPDYSAGKLYFQAERLPPEQRPVCPVQSAPPVSVPRAPATPALSHEPSVVQPRMPAAPAAVLSRAAELPRDPDAVYLIRGQKAALDGIVSGVMQIGFSFNSRDSSIDIDPYVFLVSENGKVEKEENLVFFGNANSPDSAVRYQEAGGKLVELDVRKADASIGKIVLAYAVYGESAKQNFSNVDNLEIRIGSKEGKAICFRPDYLSVEKTIVALEFYRYKGIWKLNAVGSGYRDGLKVLCESFGLQVE